ncbi:hypothetical protein Q3G72_007202 [Acer saccharum]|nr:hypothetical protein Q3G72_007202 [Acer saccharum]
MEHASSHHLVSETLRSRPPNSHRAESEISVTGLDREVGHLKETVRVMRALLDSIPQIQDDVVKLSAQMAALGGGVPGFCHTDKGREGDHSQRDLSPIMDRPCFMHRGKKLELSLFHREDAFGWLFRAERYFEINRIPEIDRVIAASICLEGRALSWFQWMETQARFASWREFRLTLLQRFGGGLIGDPTKKLLVVKQESSVAEFRDHFEVLVVTLPGIPDSIFRGAFLNGLCDDIHAEVKLYPAADLQAVMFLAQKIEERNDAVERCRKMKWSRGWRPDGSILPNNSSLGPNMVGPNPKNPSPTITPTFPSSHHEQHISSHSPLSSDNSGKPIRRLLEAKIQDHQSQGLCFRCDEKFGLGHRCLKRQLQVIFLVVDEFDMDDEVATRELLGSMDVSLHSLMGLTSSSEIPLSNIV